MTSSAGPWVLGLRAAMRKCAMRRHLIDSLLSPRNLTPTQATPKPFLASTDLLPESRRQVLDSITDVCGNRLASADLGPVSSPSERLSSSPVIPSTDLAKHPLPPAGRMPFGINNPLPSSMRSTYLTYSFDQDEADCFQGECKKAGKILASFVDPRQAFGPDKVIPPQILGNAKVRAMTMYTGSSHCMLISAAGSCCYHSI